MTDYELVFTQQARHVFQYFGINLDDLMRQRSELLRQGKIPAKIILPRRSIFSCELEFSPYVDTPVVVEAEVE